MVSVTELKNLFFFSVEEFKIGQLAIFLPLQDNFQTFLITELSSKKIIKKKPLNAQCWQSVNVMWRYEKHIVIILLLKIVTVLEWTPHVTKDIFLWILT